MASTLPSVEREATREQVTRPVPASNDFGTRRRPQRNEWLAAVNQKRKRDAESSTYGVPLAPLEIGAAPGAEAFDLGSNVPFVFKLILRLANIVQGFELHN